MWMVAARAGQGHSADSEDDQGESQKDFMLEWLQGQQGVAVKIL